MIYTLDTIPLGRFIDVYLGDVDKAVDGGHSEEEKREAAESMCQEYMEIVGGKSVLALISHRNEALKIAMRATCLRECETLANVGDCDSACKIMKSLGYSVKCDKDAILTKIKSVLASDGYKLAKMQSKPTDSVVTRDSFTKERVAIMSHLKMHIDEYAFKAKEYAYMVKQVNDEIESMMKTVKKS